MAEPEAAEALSDWSSRQSVDMHFYGALVTSERQLVRYVRGLRRQSLRTRGTSIQHLHRNKEQN